MRLVRETGKPIAQVARELGVNEGTLGNWCAQERRRHGEGALSESERDELRRLRKENGQRLNQTGQRGGAWPGVRRGVGSVEPPQQTGQAVERNVSGRGLFCPLGRDQPAEHGLHCPSCRCCPARSC